MISKKKLADIQKVLDLINVEIFPKKIVLEQRYGYKTTWFSLDLYNGKWMKKTIKAGMSAGETITFLWNLYKEGQEEMKKSKKK